MRNQPLDNFFQRVPRNNNNPILIQDSSSFSDCEPYKPKTLYEEIEERMKKAKTCKIPLTNFEKDSLKHMEIPRICLEIFL